MTVQLKYKNLNKILHLVEKEKIKNSEKKTGKTVS